MRYVLIVIAAMALLVLSLFLRYRLRHRQVPATDFKTTDEMMAWLADEAVDIAKNNRIKLDYSLNSIEQAEQMLGQLHEQYRNGQIKEGAKGLAMTFGAYVGECIRRDTPGSRWDRDHPVAGEKSYPISWKGGESFPCAWCYKRIVNGPEDNVWHKYRVLSEERATTLPE